MYWIPVILVGVILLIVELIWTRNFLRVLIIAAISALIMGATVSIDHISKTMDTEVWSGKVVDWEHREEWDEWHPPVTNCTSSTDSNGRTTQKCTTEPGYLEHHYATNQIKTSDAGWIGVGKSPDGKSFNDSWPNDAMPLQQYWPKGTPSASNHSYINKVQASYSVYRHKEINLKDFPDLPKYPQDIKGHIHIDRIVGEVPNKQEALIKLATWNTELNEFIPDPENPNKKRSWKQVNVIFANVGVDKPQEYGFALQDKWEGGNKNDFVIAFSVDANNNILWTYPFSWSEVEILKIEVRDYMNSLKQINNFVPIIDQTSKMIAGKFERKKFADFNYLQIEVSNVAYLIIMIFSTIALGVGVTLTVLQLKEQQKRHGRRY